MPLSHRDRILKSNSGDSNWLQFLSRCCFRSTFKESTSISQLWNGNSPLNNVICVQFPTRCCFQGKYFKSYSHQCHSYRRDIVSMTWLPQFWSGDSPRQHTHVCVQFLSRCWFRFRLSRIIYNSPKLEWVSSWKGTFSCTSTSYWKTLKYWQLSKT